MPEVIYEYEGRVVYRLPVTTDELIILRRRWQREAARKVKNKK
jgi:hypothetical protein